MAEQRIILIAGFGLKDTTGLSNQYSSQGYTPLHTLSVEDTLHRIHEIELGSNSVLEAVVVGNELHPFPSRLSGKIDEEEFAKYLDGRVSEGLGLDKYGSQGGVDGLIGAASFPKDSKNAGILLGLYRVFGEPREGEDVPDESAIKIDSVYRQFAEFVRRYQAFVQYAKQIPVLVAELQGDKYVVSPIALPAEASGK